MQLAVASYREPGSDNGFGDGLAPCSIVHSLCLICPEGGLVVVFAVSVVWEVETLTHTPCFHFKWVSMLLVLHVPVLQNTSEN